MFSINDLFKMGKTMMTKERVTGWCSEKSNMYLYPAMKDAVKSIRRNHGMIIDPSDGSSAKVRAVVETSDGQIAAWLADDTIFALCKINIIKGLPIITARLLNDAKNEGSIERSIRHYNDTHDYVIVSWIAC